MENKTKSPRFYILKCRIHKGEIYSIFARDNICAYCDKIKSKKLVTQK